MICNEVKIDHINSHPVLYFTVPIYISIYTLISGKKQTNLNWYFQGEEQRFFWSLFNKNNKNKPIVKRNKWSQRPFYDI